MKNPKEELFDSIAEIYDKVNDLMSFSIHRYIKISVIKDLKLLSTSKVLDACCGTGDFTYFINRYNKKISVIGIDISENMLSIAKQKNRKGVFLKEDCTNMSFGDEEFSEVICSFGLRNIDNREKALSEIYRVLKSNGKFLHLDFGYHNFTSVIFKIIIKLLIRIFNLPEKQYEYLLESKNKFPEPDMLVKEFEKFGFTCIEKKEFLFGAISCQIMIK